MERKSSVLNPIKDFLKLESASGILLVIAAIIAMILANSPLAKFYNLLIELPVEVKIGPLHLAKPLLLWINDGLMAIFFFLVRLELKREVLEGALSDSKKIALPAMGAVGGMALPALIYVAINWGDPVAMKGWAIPAATDIAFALGILSPGRPCSNLTQSISGIFSDIRRCWCHFNYRFFLYQQGIRSRFACCPGLYNH